MNLARPGARRRWSIVAAVIALLVATPIVVAAWPARAARVDPQVLRERILASAARPYQGYVESSGRLALPAIPQLGDVVGLFGGTTSMRVWHAAPRSWRVAVLDPVAEHDFYATDAGAYTWDYGRNLWTEILGDPPVRLPWAPDLLPPDLARRLLAAPAPGDRLETLPTRRVAGVSAAGLRLTPGDPDTTIGHVDVWADPATGLPLRIDLPGAFTSRFLDLRQEPPDPAVLVPDASDTSGFAATDRPGITAALNSVSAANLPSSLAGRARASGPVSAVAVYGSGLSKFVVVALPGRQGARVVNAIRDGGGAVVPGGYVLGSAVLTVLASRPTGRRAVGWKPAGSCSSVFPARPDHTRTAYRLAPTNVDSDGSVAGTGFHVIVVDPSRERSS